MLSAILEEGGAVARWCVSGVDVRFWYEDGKAVLVVVVLVLEGKEFWGKGLTCDFWGILVRLGVCAELDSDVSVPG